MHLQDKTLVVVNKLLIQKRAVYLVFCQLGDLFKMLSGLYKPHCTMDRAPLQSLADPHCVLTTQTYIFRKGVRFKVRISALFYYNDE